MKTHLDKIADISMKLPLPVINDINRRIGDWLASGGKENDSYVEQQLRYAERFIKKAKVVSGFPGIGKTFSSRDDVLVLDSDSTSFSWIEKGVRHPGFPENYIKHIQDNIDKADYIFISSHDVVRHALRASNMPYTLVYPSRELKEEYLLRYQLRGNEQAFIDLMDVKWDDFINQIEAETFPKLIKLGPGEYLQDVLHKV